ncbi:MAG TPA: ROK family transcriptional regulator [Jatrophihabitantaceae bacterium]|jgi:predicted NBD/HSP70 family sugar kinase
MPKTPKSTTTVRDLRSGNQSRALWDVYLNGPLTRQEIADHAGLSLASVSNLVGALLRQGVVEEVGLEDSNGGRPRGLLQVNPEYGFVIGVDMGETAFLVELFDLGMQVRARHVSTTTDEHPTPDEAVGHMLDGIRAVTAEAGVDDDRILGIGVAVPGLVEHGRDANSDAVVHGQSIGWPGVPLERMLRRGTDLPILIDNGAKTLGQAEKWFGAARDTDDAVIVLLGIGAGTCIISNRQLYRGATSSAGEWGHTTVSIDGRLCRCGARGCLEAYIGAGAIAARYDQLRRRRRRTRSIELEERVAAILNAGPNDAAAREVVKETVDYLGAGIADLVNLFNPERVVVGGWLGQALTERLLTPIRKAAGKHALTLPFSHVEIVEAALGKDAVALGAATLPVASLLAGGAVTGEPYAHSRARARPGLTRA